MVSALEKVILGIEAREKMKTLAELLPNEMEAVTRKAMGSAWSEEFKKAIPGIHIDWDNRPIMEVKERVAQYGKRRKSPHHGSAERPCMDSVRYVLYGGPLGCIADQGTTGRNAGAVTHHAHIVPDHNIRQGHCVCHYLHVPVRSYHGSGEGIAPPPWNALHWT